jgi:chorismate mutase/prephenate dehydrogenase
MQGFSMTLDELRRELDQLDGDLLSLVARRQAIGRQIAEAKRSTGRATRDYAREREVILGVRARAEALGLPGELAEDILRLLIRSSLTTQEQARVAAQGVGSGRGALVIGGAGKMGGWFVQFLGSQGFAVQVADPNGAAPGIPVVADWRALDDLDVFDFIVVATPLSASGPILSELALRRPRGVVFDLGSLKSPLRGGLNALKAAGVKVTSLHPMFGPSTELLSDRHVIFVDMGSPEALEAARGLFAPTMAEQVVMGLDEHDRLIAYVLGLSHALNITFFTALAESGEAAPRLARLSSTTFDAQLDVATAVSEESPELYFEIQALNDFGAESLEALARSVDRLRTAVLKRDFPAFKALMQQGFEYLKDRKEVVQRRA